MCVSSRPKSFGMTCLRERQTRFSSSICWPKLPVARISDCSLLTSVLHLCALEHVEEIVVKVPSGIKSSRFWRLTSAVNETRKASKHWQEFSCDKLVTKMPFPTERHRSVYLQAVCDNLDLEQHGGVWQMHSRIISPKRRREIVCLRLEHQKETHLLKRRISVDDFGWHVELDQRCVKSLLDAMEMNHCKSVATPGSKRQESSHVETEKFDP